MARIGLQQNVIAAARLAARGQAVVHQEMMRRNHPVGAIGAEGLAVDKHRGLAAGGQAHDNALALRRLRQRHLAAHPAILKAVSPLRAHRHRRKFALRRFLRREVLCGQKALHLHGAERQIEILLQRFHPMAQTALPFRMHVLHWLPPKIIYFSQGFGTKSPPRHHFRYASACFCAVISQSFL